MMMALPDNRINDLGRLNALKKICFTKQDLRAGWIGAGIPKTDNPEFQALAKWAAEHWYMYASFLPEITNHEADILDIGSGIGHSTINLAKLFPRAKIIAVDNDLPAVEFAKQYNHGRTITYLADDFFRFQSQKKFQYIFCLEVFEHLPPELHDLFMEKCLSLLTPDGKLLLTTPNALDEPDAMYGHIGMLNRTRARDFFQRYQKNITVESFIDNRQLLTGQMERIVTTAPFTTYEEGPGTKSHFRLVMTAQPENVSLPSDWSERYLAGTRQWNQRHRKDTMTATTKKRIYQVVSLIPEPVRAVGRKLLKRAQGQAAPLAPTLVALPIPHTEPLANWHENFIVHLASVLQPNVYVELGLYQCELFNRVVPFADRLLGVDTAASAGTFMEKESGKSEFFHGTTDDFAKNLATRKISIDLLFIDANHSKESVLADFRNYFPLVGDQGVILLHDGYPQSAKYSEPGYCGDGYKAIAELSRKTEAYEMMTIPRHPGLTLCRKRTKQLLWL